MKKIAFTIVLNGMPFIKKQYEIIPKIFDEWYVIEGAVRPILDTSWCSPIESSHFNENALSVDGTTEFLDSIKCDNIHVIRKNDFWDGKLEMCNSFIDKIENCILMQIDVDEIWRTNTLEEIFHYSETNDGFDGMLFACNYFLGPNLKIVSTGGYADHAYEWSRLWKVESPTTWVSHEPPRLNGCNRLLTKEYTKSKGWVFNHYAYVIESQLRFKENFYGYANAYNEWKSLQLSGKYPCKAGEFLSWIKDNTLVDTI